MYYKRERLIQEIKIGKVKFQFGRVMENFYEMTLS